MRRFPVNKLTSLALFATLSLALYGLESALPPPVPLPGVKLGLANIITIVVLKKYSARDALCVLSVRILLSAMLFGQAVSLLYSLAGGLLCLAGMSLIHHLLQGHFLPLTSILGAVCHNIGQLLAAFFLTAIPGVLAYLPFLMLSGILTGLFTGCCAQFMLRLLKQPTSAPLSAPEGDDGNSERSR